MQKYLWICIVLFSSMITVLSCAKVEKQPMAAGVDISDSKQEETPTDVMIYIGHSSWITIEKVRVEASITKGLLASNGVRTEITENDERIKDWMIDTTADGSVNVCILYGVIPGTIYAAGNSQSDGSIAENWIESTDGNTILNQGDYLGYYSSDDTPNYKAPLQNLMDLPHVDINVENFEDLTMHITNNGRTLTPSLVNFESDRPFPLQQLGSEWFAEHIFASDTGDLHGILADPVILRDGNRGRIAIIYQTHHADNPKGVVAAEIINNYLLIK